MEEDMSQHPTNKLPVPSQSEIATRSEPMPPVEQSQSLFPPHPLRPVAFEAAHTSAPEIPQWADVSPLIDFHLLRHAQSLLFTAPLTTPYYILDVGCGTGQWMVAMAARFPAATIRGLDRAKRLGTHAMHMRFIQANVLERLPLADATMDYVHIKNMATSIPITHWPTVIHESLRVLRPGGWLEIVELGTPQIGHPTLWEWIAQLGHRYGYGLFAGPDMSSWLTKAGAINIASREERVIWNPNSGMTARLLIRDGIALAEQLRTAVLANGITSAQFYDERVQLLQQNLFLTGRQDSIPVHATVSQRAIPAEEAHELILQI